jgi:uncharacterized protein
MDSRFNHRHAQIRAAKLRRQAEIHRLAEHARARGAGRTSRLTRWLRRRSSARVIHLDNATADIPSRELRHAKAILLTTHKRDGSGVDTPVSIAFEGDRAFFRTWNKAWKSKRLARNRSVAVAPCTLRGKATGAALSAQVRLLQGRDARVAARALARRHPLLQRLLVPLTHRLMGYRTLHYELIWDPPTTDTGRNVPRG